MQSSVAATIFPSLCTTTITTFPRTSVRAVSSSSSSPLSANVTYGSTLVAHFLLSFFRFLLLVCSFHVVNSHSLLHFILFHAINFQCYLFVFHAFYVSHVYSLSLFLLHLCFFLFARLFPRLHNIYSLHDPSPAPISPGFFFHSPWSIFLFSALVFFLVHSIIHLPEFTQGK